MKLKEAEESQIREAVRVLRDGGLVIASTETFYGILADAKDPEAVNRLLELKGRKEGKPIPLIAGSRDTAAGAAGTIPPIFESLADRFWPGPLTLVMEAGDGFPEGVPAGTGTIGIRVPAPSAALDIARIFGAPLTATSANLAGQPPSRGVRELDPGVRSAVDLVLDGGVTPGGEPSTVLDITADPPALIRAGALEKEIRQFLEQSPRSG